APSPASSGVLRRLVPPEPLPPCPVADGGRLLVIDDEEANRELLRQRLERLGHRGEGAAGGAAGLRLVAAGPVGPGACDMLMPGMSAIEVLRRLKDDPQLRPVPVIIVSSLQELDAMFNCIGTGAEDYLPRAHDVELLKARISNCLEKKRLRDREMGHLR